MLHGINKFFYRIDRFKQLLFFISIPVALACYFLDLGFFEFFLYPLSFLGLFMVIIRIPIPSEEAIIKETYIYHREYFDKIRRNKAGMDEYYNLIEGWSRKRELLCRRIGHRAIYPMCRTLIFYESCEKLEIYIKDNSAYERT